MIPVYTATTLRFQWLVRHEVSLVGRYGIGVGNIRCGGNDLRLGFYAEEWNSLGGDAMFVLCGDEVQN